MFENIKVISQTPCPGGFTHLRLAAKSIAATAQPGQWITWGHRTLQIMRSDRHVGWIELLFTGEIPAEDKIEGPYGEPLILSDKHSRSLLVAHLTELPALIFFADCLRQRRDHSTLLLLQVDDQLPFKPAPCRIMIPGMPAGVIATLPLLAEWHIALRMASHQGLPGCFDGHVDELATHWLNKQPTSDEIEYLRLIDANGVYFIKNKLLSI